MIIYPLVVAVVSAVFAGVVISQYRARHRAHQLIWSVALVMAFVASLAYVLAATTHGVLFFSLYYLFGALLMAAYLGMGSIQLFVRPRVARMYLYPLLVLSAVGAVAVLASPVHPAAVAHLHGGPGTHAIALGPLALILLILLNSFGAAAVIIVALLSGWRMHTRSATAGFVRGNVLLAVGVLIISMAGTMARLGSGGGFWLTMALGWIVLFAGFVVLNQPQARSGENVRA